MKDEREANVMFNKTGQGSVTNRITLPVGWVRDLEITEYNRTVILIKKENEIIIKKLYKNT